MSLSTLTLLLEHYGYYLLFPTAVIEGPIVTILTGALVSLRIFSFLTAYIVVSAGDILGDIIWYAVGRYGGLPFIRRWGIYMGIKESHLGIMERLFKRHEVKSYFLGKLAHGAGGAVLVVAGLVKAPFDRFVWWNVIATLIKSFALLLLGYYFAHALTQVSSVLDLIASITVIVTVVGGFAFIWWYGKKEEI